MNIPKDRARYIEVILKEDGLKDVKLIFTPNPLDFNTSEETAKNVSEIVKKFLSNQISISTSPLQNGNGNGLN